MPLSISETVINDRPGYITTQVPTNMILDKMRPSIFLPAIMCMWATVSTCTGAVQSYHGMIVLRFFLGFVEAPFFRKSIRCCILIFFADGIQLVLSTFSARGTPNASSPSAFPSSTLRDKWQALLVDFSAQQSWVAWKAKQVCPRGAGKTVCIQTVCETYTDIAPPPL
jgi:hypothetical protein